MGARARANTTTAEVYLALLKARGVDWLFANAGTDFAPIIEALARGRAEGIAMPEAVAIAHETTAVAMAHGYTLMTGRPQAVMVHVNVGLANALMGVVNAARDNVPMLITSGRTPLTEHGRLGSRDLPIHWGQEMFDQGGMLRELVKWDYELRDPIQIEAVVDRALTLASGAPQGPVYLSLPREVLAAPFDGLAAADHPRQAIPTQAFPDAAAIEETVRVLAKASSPLIIAARGDAAVFDSLAQLAEKAAIPVAHFWPGRLALPTSHPMHAGFDVSDRIGEADVIIVLDTMVPWLPARHELAADCKVVQIGPDPSFSRLPMRTFKADIAIRSGVAEALEQLASAVPEVSRRRRKALAATLAEERALRFAAADAKPAGLCTNSHVSRVLDRLKGEDAIVFNELGCDPSVMSFTRPDSYFGHPIAGGLGWGVPAALGAKLAARDRLVIACVGDGSYMFANPVATHQTAEAMELPVLTIVFNNQVWNAVRKSTRAVYPKGHAAKANEMPLSSLTPSPDFEKVVAASRGLGLRVERPDQLEAALRRGIDAVRNGQQALVNVKCAIGM